MAPSAGQRLGDRDQDRGAFVRSQGFRAEGPAGPYQQVAAHPKSLRFVEDGLEACDPFVAEPGQGGAVERVGAGGEGDGTDLHAADAGVFHHPELPQEFGLVDTVAVPPPADIGPVARVGLGELAVDVPYIQRITVLRLTAGGAFHLADGMRMGGILAAADSVAGQSKAVDVEGGDAAFRIILIRADDIVFNRDVTVDEAVACVRGIDEDCDPAGPALRALALAAVDDAVAADQRLRSERALLPAAFGAHVDRGAGAALEVIVFDAHVPGLGQYAAGEVAQDPVAPELQVRNLACVEQIVFFHRFRQGVLEPDAYLEGARFPFYAGHDRGEFWLEGGDACDLDRIADAGHVGFLGMGEGRRLELGQQPAIFLTLNDVVVVAVDVDAVVALTLESAAFDLDQAAAGGEMAGVGIGGEAFTFARDDLYTFECNVLTVKT